MFKTWWYNTDSGITQIIRSSSSVFLVLCPPMRVSNLRAHGCSHPFIVFVLFLFGHVKFSVCTLSAASLITISERQSVWFSSFV